MISLRTNISRISIVNSVLFLSIWVLILNGVTCFIPQDRKMSYYSNLVLKSSNRINRRFKLPRSLHLSYLDRLDKGYFTHQPASKSSSMSMMMNTCNLYNTPLKQRTVNGLLFNSVGYLLLRLSSQKSLTPSGLIHATILGIGLWTFLGLPAYLLCVSYLVLGSLVTKVKKEEKEKLGIAEKRGGARGPENVWGSAAASMLCAIGAHIFKIKHRPFLAKAFEVGYVAALATKLSDTFQSEIGKAFGKTTILITNLKRVPRGTEGAVSMEGYIAGIIGGSILSLLAKYFGLINHPKDILLCIFTSLIGTTAESFIGASFQSNEIKWLTNEFVNFINTIIGATVAIVISIFMSNV
jgi:uncharacterized protein (TIGR00297 family)